MLHAILKRALLPAFVAGSTGRRATSAFAIQVSKGLFTLPVDIRPGIHGLSGGKRVKNVHVRRLEDVNRECGQPVAKKSLGHEAVRLGSGLSSTSPARSPSFSMSVENRVLPEVF